MKRDRKNRASAICFTAFYFFYAGVVLGAPRLGPARQCTLGPRGWTPGPSIGRKALQTTRQADTRVIRRHGGLCGALGPLGGRSQARHLGAPRVGPWAQYRQEGALLALGAIGTPAWLSVPRIFQLFKLLNFQTFKLSNIQRLNSFSNFQTFKV